MINNIFPNLLINIMVRTIMSVIKKFYPRQYITNNNFTPVYCVEKIIFKKTGRKLKCICKTKSLSYR